MSLLRQFLLFIIGTVGIALALPVVAQTAALKKAVSPIPARAIPPVKHATVWTQLPSSKKGAAKGGEISDPFYQKAMQRSQKLQDLEYQASVLKLENQVLQLSLANQAQKNLLTGGRSVRPPVDIASEKASAIPIPMPTPVELHLLALFIKDKDKSAELDYNGDHRVVHEGEHIGNYVVQTIDDTGISLSDTKKHITHLAVE